MRGGGWDAEERGETGKEIGISTPTIMKHLDAGSAMGFALMACHEGGRKGREAGGDRGWKLGGTRQPGHFTLITLKSRSDRNTSR